MQQSPLRQMILKELIVKIHSERQHASTDGTRELRIELARPQLQILERLAVKGLTGTRPQRPHNPYAQDEADGDDDASPSPLRVWTPAALIIAALPEVLLDYEHTKRLARPRAGKAAQRSPHHSTGAHRPAVKATTTKTRAAPYKKMQVSAKLASTSSVTIISSSDDDERGCASPEVIDLT